jgi:hypothetical protein
MDKITEVFLSWQLLLVSFSTFIVFSTIKRLGTIRSEDGTKVIGGFAYSKPWKMLQPVLPYPISIGLTFIPGVTIPDIAGETFIMKIIFGLMSGWMADKVFQIVKNILERAGVKFPEKEE